jgi:hypothetical protein
MRVLRSVIGVLVGLTVILTGGLAQANSNWYFTQIRYNDIDAVANHDDCLVVTDNGNMVFELLVDQALHDLMDGTLSGGGSLLVSANTGGAASTPEGSAASYDVKVRVIVVHAGGGSDTLKKRRESMTAPPSFSTNTLYQFKLHRADLNLIAVGDTLRFRAFGSGQADPGACFGADNPIVTWGFTQSGHPVLNVVS